MAPPWFETIVKFICNFCKNFKQGRCFLHVFYRIAALKIWRKRSRKDLLLSHFKPGRTFIQMFFRKFFKKSTKTWTLISSLYSLLSFIGTNLQKLTFIKSFFRHYYCIYFCIYFFNFFFERFSKFILARSRPYKPYAGPFVHNSWLKMAVKVLNMIIKECRSNTSFKICSIKFQKKKFRTMICQGLDCYWSLIRAVARAFWKTLYQSGNPKSVPKNKKVLWIKKTYVFFA